MSPSTCSSPAGWPTRATLRPNSGGGKGDADVTATDINALWAALLDHRPPPAHRTDARHTPHAHARKQIYSGYGIWITRRGTSAPTYTIRGGDPRATFRSSCY